MGPPAFVVELVPAHSLYLASGFLGSDSVAPFSQCYRSIGESKSSRMPRLVRNSAAIHSLREAPRFPGAVQEATEDHHRQGLSLWATFPVVDLRDGSERALSPSKHSAERRQDIAPPAKEGARTPAWQVGVERRSNVVVNAAIGLRGDTHFSGARAIPATAARTGCKP